MNWFFEQMFVIWSKMDFRLKLPEECYTRHFSVHICRHVAEVYFERHIALLLVVMCKPPGGCDPVAELVFNSIAVAVEFVTKIDGPVSSSDRPRMGVPLPEVCGSTVRKRR